MVGGNLAAPCLAEQNHAGFLRGWLEDIDIGHITQ